MPVAIVASLRIIKFGFIANVDSLWIVPMHVVNESQVVVNIRMFGVQLRTDPKVLNSHVVKLIFEVSQPKVVLKLCVFGFDIRCPHERFDSLVIMSHLIQSDSKEEESSLRLSIGSVKLVKSLDFQQLPVLLLYDAESLLFKLILGVLILLL